MPGKFGALCHNNNSDFVESLFHGRDQQYWFPVKLQFHWFCAFITAESHPIREVNG